MSTTSLAAWEKSLGCSEGMYLLFKMSLSFYESKKILTRGINPLFKGAKLVGAPAMALIEGSPCLCPPRFRVARFPRAIPSM
jgi:hypothetical protein